MFKSALSGLAAFVSAYASSIFILRVRDRRAAPTVSTDRSIRGLLEWVRILLRALRGASSLAWRWPFPGAAGDGGQARGKMLEARAVREVERRCPGVRRTFPRLHDQLVALWRSYLEVDEPGAPSDKRDDVLLKAGVAVEATLCEGICVGVSTYLQMSKVDQSINRFQLDGIRECLGFHGPLPRAFGAVTRGALQQAEERREGQLRTLTVLTLLRADWDTEHPLRCAAAECPTLLIRLDELAEARNQCVHHRAQRRCFSRSRSCDEMRQHVETAFLCIELLLDEPGPRPISMAA